MAFIEARGLGKAFSKRRQITALSDLNVCVEKNEFVSIIGPSGCGKSTFLLMAAGLEKATKGEILFKGRKILGPDPERAIVFQEYLLFPWKTVRKNIEFGPKVRGKDSEEQKRISYHLMDLVGLKAFENQYPHELSGGMKQRVAIARALANNPSLLLMDEPFGALDALTREMMQAELLNIWQQAKCTVLFVTHSISEAIYLSDRVLIMSRRPGKIIADIPVGLPRPRTRETLFLPEFKTIEKDLRQMVWKEVSEANP
ncbi:MAG: ABC transporter ATP-binding protein [Desulfobacteraceae bacterium]|nr:ABC transporter ATP-binding protein [Desulfobacteraceae bacterium]MBU4038068.1 ABC transporter ATP-binding protein [Pseudomonadota bacterium]